MKKLILCFDSGDTLIDTDTEVHPPMSELVLDGQLIPGAKEALLSFHEQGYRMCLIADGLVQSFHNLLEPKGIWDMFETHIISEAMCTRKPDPRMFDQARINLGLDKSEFKHMVMFGNNRKRDINGAKRLGMKTICIDYSPKFSKIAECPDEEPDFITMSPSEWPAIIAKLEAEAEAEEA